MQTASKQVRAVPLAQGNSTLDSHRYRPNHLMMNRIQTNPQSGIVLVLCLGLLCLVCLSGCVTGGNTGKHAFSTGTKRWTNSLGMVFVPVPGTKTYFSVWETRVKDYAAFAGTNASVDPSWRHPLYHNTDPVSFAPDHPATSVSWTEAKQFCAWLTAKEQAEKLIPTDVVYRLPTDEEWSWAVGIGGRETNGTPQNKNAKLRDVYPWGTQWPPPPGAGNYADVTARKHFTNWADIVIPGYDDGFVTTAPVGSFKPNALGIYDLGGNAVEWCQDWYNEKHTQRVFRGGAWVNCGPKSLLSSSRGATGPNRRSVITGFRCVLAWK